MNAAEPQHLLAEAQALAARGDFAAALVRMDALAARDPRSATAHFNRANLLQQMQRFDDAVSAYSAAFKLTPNTQILLNRASALRALGRNGEALSDFDAVLSADPNNLQALVGCGVTLGLLQRPSDALAAFDAALHHAPNLAIAHHNRGKALYTLDRFGEARAAYETALRLDPNYASAWNNYGVALEALGERAASVDAFRRAVALRHEQAPELCDPRTQNAQFNLGVALLRAGEYAEGFTLYEHRFETGAAARADHGDLAPLWRGEHVDGVLRIWAEQGPGDQLVFAQLLPLVLERTDRVVLEIDPRLVRLMQSAYPNVEVRSHDAPLRGAAAQTAIGALPRALGLSLCDLPTKAPLLCSDAQARACLRARYEELAKGRPIVGLAWGSPRAPYAAQKSAPLGEWSPLLSREYFFVSLQYGDAARDVAEARALIYIDPEIDQLRDMDAFAAQVGATDHIVSVSNTLAHLAGAMGLPARIVVPHGRGLHWYWGLEGESTPWYPSLHLIRRGANENWSAAIARAAASLESAS